MFKSYHNLVILLFSMVVLRCSAPEPSDEKLYQVDEDTSEQYWISFYKIDNQVKVYVDDDLIFDSFDLKKENLENIVLNLDEDLDSGRHKIRIDLYNDSPYDGFMGFDKHWEVYYEFFRYEVPIDYIHEKGDDGKKGLVFSQTHEIEVI